MTPSCRTGAPVVLTLGLTDPTGGSGVQGDVLTLSSLGCQPLSVVTGNAIQDTAGHVKTLALPAGAVGDQLQLVLSDMPPAAVKIGFPGTPDDLAVLGAMLAGAHAPIVVDARLGPAAADADDPLRDAYRAHLLARTSVLIGDAAQIAILAGETDPDEAIERLLALGMLGVLVTAETDGDDSLANTLHRDSHDPVTTQWRRLPGAFHGARDTLSAALTAMLGNGLALEDAAREAQEYTWQALAHGTRPGRGRQLPDRFFWIRHLGEASAA